MKLENAEIFSVGQWNSKTFTEADLDAIVASFEALNLAGRLPLKSGHTGPDGRDDGALALGWVDRVWREGKKLMADFVDIPQKVYDAIKSGAMKFVSVELLADVQAGNRQIPFVLDAVALLGATPPAVGTLKDLQSLTMRRRPPLQFGARLAFSRDSESEVETLRAEIARRDRVDVAREFDQAVRDRRILPRDRHLFEKRMGNAATLEQARAWIDGTPRPASQDRPEGTPRTFGEDRRDFDRDLPPDARVAHLARAEVEKSDGKLSHGQATMIVLRRDPALAEAYRLQPGVK